MSVVDPNVIDGMGIDGDTLVFMISDHLTWAVHQAAHLSYLRDKLNAYIRYIDEKQWRSVYRNREFESFRIEVCFKYQYPEVFVTMVEAVGDKLKEKKIEMIYQVAETEGK
ncbi:MAG: hypothetical protein IJ861_04600 [Clostridia bacterium]|nr:hypothetical protein [Clostridia bacterium]